MTIVYRTESPTSSATSATVRSRFGNATPSSTKSVAILRASDASSLTLNWRPYSSAPMSDALPCT